MTVRDMHDYCTLSSAEQLDAVVKGRNPLDGYSRGWGLQFGDLRQKILADPVYRDAMRLAQGRTIQAELCRMNLFLIVRFYLAEIASGDIIEFGSYRGGSAIFLAATAKAIGLNTHVWALDTYEGMPEVDPLIDLHQKGDFRDVDYDELVQFARQAGLDNLTFVRGRFEETMPDVIRKAKPIALAHVDCDVYSAVAYSYESVRNHMVDGGYIAFDDAHYSSCLGATEAVEDLVIRRDGKNCEQIFPHFVFRQWFAR
jgi:macrocin-O-methyltransferase TylF-like protien